MDARLRQSVRQRAAGRCEYCALRQEQEPLAFHVEHITPRSHGGKTRWKIWPSRVSTAISTREQTSPGLILKQEI